MALIDKASLLMVPSTYEAGKLYNVLPSGNRAPDNKGGAGYDQTRADFDFDRGSNAAASRINSSGLIEKYRENLLLQSNSFNTSPWGADDITLTSGHSGYDGSNDAWLVIDNNSLSEHKIIQNPQSGLSTISVYAKANTRDWLYLRGVTSSANVRAWFNVSTGVLGSSIGAVIDYNIENIGDGWYRCSMTLNQQVGFEHYIGLSTADGVSNYTGNGSSIFIQDCQVESGLVATEYLNSTSVTAKGGVLIDLPRINYDANGENGALLLEPSRQQLYPYSEYSGAWLKTDWTTTDNYAISPEGVKNAFRAVSTATGGTLYINATGVTGQKNTLSVWAKSNTSGDQKFRFFSNGYLTISNDYTATTEWQRFDFTYDCTNVTAGITGASSELSDILFYGFQQEEGSYVSSYIPNHGTSGGVTRAADSCSGGGSAESINSVEGVLFIDTATLVNTQTTDNTISVSDGGNNKILLRYRNTNVVNLKVFVNGAAQAETNYTFTDATAYNKIAFKWKLNDYALYVNGTSVFTDTSALVFPANSLNVISFDDGGSTPFFGEVKGAQIYNTALTNAELATLTTL